MTVGAWNTLKLGAGGWVTGLDIAPDGVKVCRTDAHGAYIREVGETAWRQVVTKQTMPTAYAGAQSGSGVYEIVVAPSNSQILYMFYSGSDRNDGTVFRSANGGRSWTQTAFTPVFIDANDAYRMRGYKMAVDPANPDVVYVGAPYSGVFFTTDGGASWTAEPDVGTSSADGSSIKPGHTIAFDPSSGTTDGRTNRILVSTRGTGVYESADAGATWALTTGGPDATFHMVALSNGEVWATRPGVFNNVYRYISSTWDRVTSGREYQTIAVDPDDVDRVIVADGCGSIDQTLDGGANWTGLYQPGFPVGANGMNADDIPWLEWTLEACKSNGNMVFDPTASNKLWFSMGIGVLWMNPPSTFTGFTWQSDSVGIEELVTNRIVSVPGGATHVCVWDRGAFRMTDLETYPSVHGPNRDNAIMAGWDIDYVPGALSLVGLFNFNSGQSDQSGWSDDDGVTWTKFAAHPPGSTADMSGGIAVSASDKNNIIRLGGGNAKPYRSSDRGANWTEITISGVPTSGETGWGAGVGEQRKVLCSDKGNAGTFYMYNYGPTGSDSAKGIYRSTDGGTNWDHVYTDRLSGFYNTNLLAMPRKAGHLFINGFTADGVASSNFMRSTDGGETWAAVANVSGVFFFGFGSRAPGSDYPTVHIIGSVSGVYGIWRSDDNCSSWLKLSDGFPDGRLDIASCMSGDSRRYYRTYIGWRGSGAQYFDGFRAVRF